MITEYTLKPAAKTHVPPCLTVSKAKIMPTSYTFLTLDAVALSTLYIERVFRQMCVSCTRLYPISVLHGMKIEIAPTLALFAKKVLSGKCIGGSLVDSCLLQVCPQ